MPELESVARIKEITWIMSWHRFFAMFVSVRDRVQLIDSTGKEYVMETQLYPDVVITAVPATFRIQTLRNAIVSVI
jgi:hypothetical protein